MTLTIRAALLASGLAAGAAPALAQGLAGPYLAGRHADVMSDVDGAADFYTEALRGDPEALGLTERALVNLIAAGRVTPSVKLAEALFEAAPEHRLAGLALVADAVSRGDLDAARATLEAGGDAFHPLVRGLLEAWISYELDGAEPAREALRGADENDLLRVFGRYHLGLLEEAAGNPEAAAEAFAEAAEGLGRPSSRLARAWGAALERAGRAEEARALYEDAAAEGFGDAAVEAALARLEAGDPPPEPLVTTAAEGAAEALFGLAGILSGDAGRRFALAYAQLASHLRPDLIEARILVAELLTAADQHDLAAQAFAAVPVEHPLRLRAQLGRADALRRQDRDEAAAEALRALAALRPDSVEAQAALGDQLRRMELWEEAAQAYSAAIDGMAAEDRESWTLFYQRGVAHERAGEWEQAEDDFQTALALEPEQPLVLNYLGYSWVEMGRNLDEARDMIERAVALRPEDGYITDSLGWVLYRLGDYEGAVEQLEQAVELTPTDPVINDHLGDAYWRVGRRLEAEFQWRRARSFEPEPEALERIRRKLEVGLDRVLEEEAAEAAAAAEPEEPAPAADGG
jgi:tetratricopeptide (TPR) repeat protein